MFFLPNAKLNPSKFLVSTIKIKIYAKKSIEGAKVNVFCFQWGRNKSLTFERKICLYVCVKMWGRGAPEGNDKNGFSEIQLNRILPLRILLLGRRPSWSSWRGLSWRVPCHAFCRLMRSCHRRCARSLSCRPRIVS